MLYIYAKTRLINTVQVFPVLHGAAYNCFLCIIGIMFSRLSRASLHLLIKNVTYDFQKYITEKDLWITKLLKFVFIYCVSYCLYLYLYNYIGMRITSLDLHSPARLWYCMRYSWMIIKTINLDRKCHSKAVMGLIHPVWLYPSSALFYECLGILTMDLFHVKFPFLTKHIERHGKVNTEIP